HHIYPLSLHDALPIYHERNEQQESDAEDHRNREEALPDRVDDSAALFRLDVPDGVHRILELPEHPRGAKEQGDDSDDHRDRAALDRKSTRLNSSHLGI